MGSCQEAAPDPGHGQEAPEVLQEVRQLDWGRLDRRYVLGRVDVQDHQLQGNNSEAAEDD
jgi:hypothetical protein